MFKHLSLYTLFLLTAAVLGTKLLHFKQIGEGLYLSDYRTNFLQSLAACRKNGLNLVSLESDAESQELQDNLVLAGYSGSNIWIGGLYYQDREFTPSWIWLDTGKEVNYTNWGSSQPLSPYSFNCMMMSAVDNYNGQWETGACTRALYFACH